MRTGDTWTPDVDTYRDEGHAGIWGDVVRRGGMSRQGM